MATTIGDQDDKPDFMYEFNRALEEACDWVTWVLIWLACILIFVYWYYSGV